MTDGHCGIFVLQMYIMNIQLNNYTLDYLLVFVDFFVWIVTHAWKWIVQSPNVFNLNNIFFSFFFFATLLCPGRGAVLQHAPVLHAANTDNCLVCCRCCLATSPRSQHKQLPPSYVAGAVLQHIPRSQHRQLPHMLQVLSCNMFHAASTDNCLICCRCTLISSQSLKLFKLKCVGNIQRSHDLHLYIRIN